MHQGDNMRTTLNLPDALVEEAMQVTHITTKTELIKTALANLIQRERVKELSSFFGKVSLDIDLDISRKR